MRHRHRFALLALCALTLALPGCMLGGGDGVKKHFNPPRASVQQLTVLPSGQWRVVLRLQNFSNVPSKFNSVSGNLKFAGQAAGGFAASPNISIGPESADTVEATVSPSFEAKVAVASALSASQSIRYEIEGQIGTDQRNAPYDFKYESSLNPAPGLPGVLR